ncbi:MAG: hypothetical protein JWN44_5739, partial [Myxococcales bacterium]|nr:hypothetical protein [Myxococcales bacterium]
SGGSGGSGGGGSGGGGTQGCVAGPPATVVANLRSVSQLAVDDHWVYYIDEGPTSLWRTAKDGSGTPERVAFLGTFNDDVYAWDYAVDASTIYVMHYGRAGMTLSPGSVDYYDKSLALVRHVDAAPAPGDCHTPLLKNITVAGGDLYWLQSNGTRAATCPNAPDEIRRVPAGSSRVDAITAGSDKGGVTGIFADGAHVFWSDADGISRIGRAGGAREIIAPGYGARMASDGNNLFVEATSGSVERIAAPNVYATIYDHPFADMENDGAHLYVATGSVKGGGAVLRMNGDGSGMATLAAVNAFTLAVDDSSVYFAEDTVIEKTCK